MVVEEELAEQLKPLREVLVGKVDGRMRDTRSMRSDRVRYMSGTDGVQVLSIRRRAYLLHEALRVEVVVVSRHKDVDVPHQLQHVQTLFERLARKLNL